MAHAKFLLLFLLSAFGCSGAWVISTNFHDVEDVDVNELRETRRERLNLIFPGTKWCGSGDVAENYDDLGTFEESDACCRQHDHCDDIIEAMQTKHNLTNPSFYTRLHCSCDEKFFDCLHNSGDRVGDKVGVLYFTFLGSKCFREDFPIRGCKRYSSSPKRCLEYELDESQAKKYQWFDVPLF